MNKVLVIAQREIQERAFVFAVAAALAAAPFLGLLRTSGTLYERKAAVVVISMIVSVGFILGLAMITGASLVGREMREKRLSFYFARPVSPVALWIGKLLGAAALVIGAAAILIIPPMVVAETVALRGYSGLIAGSSWRLILWLLAIALSLLLICHTVGTWVRSRSPWIVLDVVAAGLFKLALLAAGVTMMMHGAVEVLKTTAIAVWIVVAAVLIAGGGWQLAQGRIDRVRAHRSLSLFVWPLLALLVLVLGGYVMWLQSARPEDLVADVQVTQRRGTTLGFITGRGANRGDYVSLFLVDAASGKSIKVPHYFLWTGEVNANGTAAAWLEPADKIREIMSLGRESSRVPHDVVVARRSDAGFEERQTLMSVPLGRNTRFALSDDSSRIAVLSENVLSVFDVRSKNLLAAAPLQTTRNWASQLRFVSRDVVHAIVTDRKEGSRVWSVLLAELDVRTRHLKPLLRTTAIGNDVGAGEFGNRLLLKTAGGWGAHNAPLEATDPLRVFDTAAGREIQAVKLTPGRSRPGGWLLADGGLAVLDFAAQDRAMAAELDIYSAAGTKLRSVTMPLHSDFRLLGQSGSRLLVASRAVGSVGTTGRGWRIDSVELTQGAVTTVLRDYRPAEFEWMRVSVGGGAQAYLLVDAAGRVVSWNPATGALKVITGRSQS